jgi:hypothetical protein
MGIRTIVFLAVLPIASIYAVRIFNNLVCVRLRDNVSRAWSSIELAVAALGMFLPRVGTGH